MAHSTSRSKHQRPGVKGKFRQKNHEESQFPSPIALLNCTYYVDKMFFSCDYVLIPSDRRTFNTNTEQNFFVTEHFNAICYFRLTP